MAKQRSTDPPRPRFRLEIVEGPAHGGPFELEQTTTWQVIDLLSGQAVLTYEGEYSASFDGTYDNGSWSGVSAVRLAPDGRHVQVQHANGPLETRLIPGAESVPPLAPFTPPPEFPLKLEGVAIKKDTDLHAVVRRVLRGKVSTRQKEHPPLFLVELYDWLRYTSRADEYARAVGALIQEGDARARSAALYFYARHPTADGFEAVAALAEADPNGAGATPTPIWTFERLPGAVPLSLIARRAWERHLAKQVPNVLDQRCAQLLKTVLVDPACPWPELDHKEASARSYAATDAMKGLAASAEWLADNAARLERTRRGRFQPLFYALGHANRPELLPVAARALISSRAVSSTKLRAWADSQPESPAMRALRAVL